MEAQVHFPQTESKAETERNSYSFFEDSNQTDRFIEDQTIYFPQNESKAETERNSHSFSEKTNETSRIVEDDDDKRRTPCSSQRDTEDK